jgi:hypothetical protein
VARAAEDINRPGGYKRDPWASLTGGGRTWTRLAGQRVEEAPVGTDNCGGWLVGVGVERSCSGNRALTGVGVGGGWASTCVLRSGQEVEEDEEVVAGWPAGGRGWVGERGQAGIDLSVWKTMGWVHRLGANRRKVNFHRPALELTEVNLSSVGPAQPS